MESESLARREGSTKGLGFRVEGNFVFGRVPGPPNFWVFWASVLEGFGVSVCLRGLDPPNSHLVASSLQQARCEIVVATCKLSFTTQRLLSVSHSSEPCSEAQLA